LRSGYLSIVAAASGLNIIQNGITRVLAATGIIGLAMFLLWRVAGKNGEGGLIDLAAALNQQAVDIVLMLALFNQLLRVIP
jgi:hypothetical protein